MPLPKIAPNDCPEAPGFHASLRTLILHEACQTAGGIAPLAKLLGVTSVSLDRWLEGEEEAPPEIYWACIEIVLLHDPEEEGLNARRGSGSLR
jgi:hypothetical protein